MNYALVNYPAIDIRDVEKFREKYDPSFELLKPHITVMVDIPANEVDEKQLIEHIKSIINKHRPFSVSLNKTCTSSDGLLLFLDVAKGGSKLSAIQDDIYTDLLSDYTFPHLPFRPHVTIGFFSMSNDYSKNALRDAQETQFQFNYVVDNLHLIKGDGVHPVSLVRKFSIK